MSANEIEPAGNALVLDETLTFEQWVDYGDQLARTVDGVMWWVGDWWRFGAHKYGERAKVAVESKRWSFQTFADAAWVAGRFETSRRREVLSWSHHKEVAALEPADADDLLDQAEEHAWSMRDLRTEVKLRKRIAKTEHLLALPLAALDDEPIRVTDCLALIDSLTDASVGLLLTDPPYAVTQNAWDVWETEDAYWDFMHDWLEDNGAKILVCKSVSHALTLGDTG